MVRLFSAYSHKEKVCTQDQSKSCEEAKLFFVCSSQSLKILDILNKNRITHYMFEFNRFEDMDSNGENNRDGVYKEDKFLDSHLKMNFHFFLEE